MHYVYFLRSLSNRKKTYVGMAEDVEARVRNHGQGSSPHTAGWGPWDLVAYVGVHNRSGAAKLERSFKVGSGHAWAHKHLL